MLAGQKLTSEAWPPACVASQEPPPRRQYLPMHGSPREIAAHRAVLVVPSAAAVAPAAPQHSPVAPSPAAIPRPAVASTANSAQASPAPSPQPVAAINATPALPTPQPASPTPGAAEAHSSIGSPQTPIAAPPSAPAEGTSAGAQPSPSASTAVPAAGSGGRQSGVLARLRWRLTAPLFGGAKASGSPSEPRSPAAPASPMPWGGAPSSSGGAADVLPHVADSGPAAQSVAAGAGGDGGPQEPAEAVGAPAASGAEETGRAAAAQEATGLPKVGRSCVESPTRMRSCARRHTAELPRAKPPGCPDPPATAQSLRPPSANRH
jgi:hypothetical protein